MIDWECEIKTLFRTKNVGCGAGVKTAIDYSKEYLYADKTQQLIYDIADKL